MNKSTSSKTYNLNLESWALWYAFFKHKDLLVITEKSSIYPIIALTMTYSIS